MMATINSANTSQDEPLNNNNSMSIDSIWFCPSRWLLAHHDTNANISTMSSHLCLADLNSDGENLLALVDFKQSQTDSQKPYQSRLRAYRGKHLIYNHFLEDVPCCMVVTSNRAPAYTAQVSKSMLNKQTAAPKVADKLLLTLPINDDIYFYHQLKPQHRISLEDDERILDTLNRSELEAWQMVKQNKVDVETMRELLESLSDAHSAQGLTSHSNNFLALNNSEERKNYLLLWKFKKLSNGLGEHIMSMDTICCAAARLRSDVSKTSEPINSSVSTRWNKLLDIQKDGIVIGTEDRHLLVYELGYSRAYLEANYRLPATADYILVENRSPQSFDPKINLQELTYKILISCRDCRIYVVEQNYLPDRKSSQATSSKVRELIALSSNVIDMLWTGENDHASWSSSSGVESCSGSNFVVACLDRKVYCFSSETGQNKWVTELELPITCLVSLPIPRINRDETCLIGVASETNRIDFFISSSGRIVDTIYLNDEFCQAMTFGRFGREDNCLCLTTSKGSLLILILKRTAKFANAQCLSSAAAYASHVVSASCSHLPAQSGSSELAPDIGGKPSSAAQKLSQVKEPPELPKPFSIAKSTIVNPTDRALEQLQLNHNCDQVVAKEALDSHLILPRLQIPNKNRDFVNQIVHQTRLAKTTSKAFARDMLKLRDKVKLASENQGDTLSLKDANRVSVTNIIGLGNIYRVSLSLHLKFPEFLNGEEINDKFAQERAKSKCEKIEAQVILFVVEKQRRCHLRPFKFNLNLERKPELGEGEENVDENFISETSIDFKLIILGEMSSTDTRLASQEDSVALDVHVLYPQSDRHPNERKPKQSSFPSTLIGSINIPICD